MEGRGDRTMTKSSSISLGLLSAESLVFARAFDRLSEVLTSDEAGKIVWYRLIINNYSMNYRQKPHETSFTQWDIWYFMDILIMKADRKPIVYGALGSMVLFFVYIELLTIANSFSHAVEQFTSMWYLLLPLIAGFGIQIGLYSHIKSTIYARRLHGARTLAATGGVSTTSMVLCCLHHFTDVLPIIGFAAAALFLSQYQAVFILLGILSNIVGITMMLSMMQRHEMFDKNSLLSSVFKYDMQKIRNCAAVLSVIIFFSMLILTVSLGQPISATLNNSVKTQTLQTVTNNENSLTIEVTPVDFALGEPVVFSMSFNTHTGSLSYDLTKISALYDSKGKEYYPTEWEGPALGGHHVSGRLHFPPIDNTNSMKLVMKNMYDVPERTFEWRLV